ncbi:MAG: NYN domain-containing protein [Croceibacterium sp.]
MDQPDRNIALLIDADNASAAGLDAVLTVLAEFGTVNVRRAYGNWQKPALKGWSTILHRYAIEPNQQFDVAKGKSATDMKLTIDALDLLYGGRVGGFGIMSSDSDFMPLAVRIKQDGLPVFGFGTAKTPESFREACTRFIDVGALLETAEEGPRSASPRLPQPSAKRPIDDELLKLLGDAWKSAKRDEKGFASLHEVGKLAGNRSSFDTRNYGHGKLIDLIEAIPNFQVDRRDGGNIYIKRLR